MNMLPHDIKKYMVSLEERPAQVDRVRAAKFLGVHVRTLEEWAKRGIGPRVIRIGKHVRYELPDLEKFRAGREPTV